MTRFEQNLPDVLKHEGGFVNHPEDPGGATNKGITLNTYRAWYGNVSVQDLKTIPMEHVETIYRKGYWDKVRAGMMWPGMDRVAFDAAVNSGPSRSLKWIQKAVGATQDGKWGPQTRDAINGAQRRTEAVQRACAVRMGFLQGLRHWKTFGRGWSRRVAEVEAKATQEAGMGAIRREATAANARNAATGQTTGAAGAGGSPGVLWGIEAPIEVLIPLGLFMGFAVLVLLHKARHNRNRAEAYEALND